MTNKRKIKRARRAQNGTILTKRRVKYLVEHKYRKYIPRALVLNPVGIGTLLAISEESHHYKMAILASMYAEAETCKHRFEEKLKMLEC